MSDEEETTGRLSSDRIPSDWGSDALGEFLDKADHNTIATFDNLRPHYNRVRDVDAVFHALIENLTNSPDWMAGLFLLMAHSSFLAAARLALSGQIVEAMMPLRGSLEAAVYGLHVSRFPASARTYLDRHVGVPERAACRGKFIWGPLLAELQQINPALRDAASRLYELTIDHGAHPNERAMRGRLERLDDAQSATFKLHYFTVGDPVVRAGLSAVAEVGLCVLDVFRHVFSTRYKLLDLDGQIDAVKRDVSKGGSRTSR